ncbi:MULTISPECIES: inner membrane protein YpjD [Marinobacter]|uniref:Cytochrome c biogenesis protein CcsA n=1 Tax=Marinobacter suaedae TaxID=3057675 RepID=A0ABT8W3Z4_9GAMM|nr:MULTISPECIES: cytochrome c biogenesis protein CcsA [unclassified Marinobacter]MBZ2167285.1 cytochrome c biogenesis protein CcsA [Marinobacter sp. F4216]MDO3722975.1 cytochrome c biogenesis protein CcsA [Marinobacter sp. chi1]
MGTLILAVTSLLLYSVGTALQALHFRGRFNSNLAITTVIGALALISHGLLITQSVYHDGGFDFSFFKSSVLISWLIVVLLVGLNLRKPVQNLFLGAYPIAALTIILALITHAPSRLVSGDSYGMLSHIALSITAYSLFTLAALQAILLSVQNRQLKHNYNSLLVRNLPPLQTMESLLFELVWAGVVVLVLAIATGALFVEDLFAQHLAHKTVFSLLSLAVFVGLLIGRYTKGWRGMTATRWTLAGCILLMLAFYGSKFVLELLFQRAG